MPDLMVKENGESFPALIGDIHEDTTAILTEIGVGRVVTERGFARFHLVREDQSYLKWEDEFIVCDVCGEDHVLEEGMDEVCPFCDSKSVQVTQRKRFPTLEDYVMFVAERSGLSRQTIFNRLKTYKVLTGRKVDQVSVFRLNLLSSGAASMLANVDDGEEVFLVDDSWPKTVQTALDTEDKSEALFFIKHSVLNKPRYTTDIEDQRIILYVERDLAKGDGIAVEKYQLEMIGEWPEEMCEVMRRKFTYFK